MRSGKHGKKKGKLQMKNKKDTWCNSPNRKGSYKYILLILGLFLITLVNAEYIYKQNDYVNFRYICLNASNDYCDNTNIITISVDYPSGANALDNKSLTAQTTYFNVSIPTSQIGTYNAIIINHKTGGEVKNFTYEVTLSGDEQTNFTEIAFFIGIAVLVSLVIMIKISRFFGSFMIFITGIGILYKVPYQGWVGWIIIACGLIATIYALLTPSRHRRG